MKEKIDQVWVRFAGVSPHGQTSIQTNFGHNQLASFFEAGSGLGF
jgi:hypothetical protein